MKIGYCKFCKNSVMVETEGDESQYTLNDLATENCKCAGAAHYRKLKNEKETAIGIIEDMVNKAHPEAAELLKASIDYIQEDKIKSISIQACSKIKVSLTKTSKDSLKVTQVFTQKDEMDTE